jgi:type I phosphodiesterase/nucleotide pyrophosphatase
MRRWISALVFVCFLSPFSAAPATPQTKHILFVMTDGLRWQEVFGGADASLMDKGKSAIPREALMPFLWSVVAKQGQIFGNRNAGSDAYVTNHFFFSYPGYSETLCGFADPRVASNDKIPNPNVTVLEWDVFPFIFNAERAGFPVNAGYDPFTSIPGTPRLDLLNRLKAETPRVWEDEPFDFMPFHTALEYLRARKPKILYLSLGETDEWAHAGNYAEYLKAARRVDDYVRELWQMVQSMPEYRDNTTLIFSPDHGRGEGAAWKNHGEKVPDSKYIWMAFLGPDTRGLGERTQIPAVTQSQIAATLAALLGEDYAGAVPRAGKPIADVLAQ